MLAKHGMFEKFSGGETSKQGQDVETISCQANDVGQFRQTLKNFLFSFLRLVFLKRVGVLNLIFQRNVWLME